MTRSSHGRFRLDSVASVMASLMVIVLLLLPVLGVHGYGPPTPSPPPHRSVPPPPKKPPTPPASARLLLTELESPPLLYHHRPLPIEPFPLPPCHHEPPGDPPLELEDGRPISPLSILV
ncbi:hypothetical protein GUJ93_ZPchr0011g27238 [Zizania palustris]|uniref:Uncharacterized protein n=1 Tax=Zizania palustris TaxID=103762 RepID=A0A8J6BQY2_ZIZPA|nr:hypothetical protein GUJ93_ZPchr0011g27238 [Zizania palustris]